jgi:dihydroceramidase
VLTTEKDYYATVYVAEMVNTFTNLCFVYLAFKGVHSCIRYGHDTGFLAAFVSYLFIGIGSICFHISLKCELLSRCLFNKVFALPTVPLNPLADLYVDSMQLLDELSMIYMACTTFYVMFSFNQSNVARVFIFLFITSVAVFITLYYHYLKNPTFHQNMFSLLVAIVIFKSMYEMEVLLRPRWRSKEQGADKSHAPLPPSEATRREKRDLEILKTMWLMAGCGVGLVGLGFLIWNLDSIFCQDLRRWRRQIGLPWGIVLEGHGWW